MGLSNKAAAAPERNIPQIKAAPIEVAFKERVYQVAGDGPVQGPLALWLMLASEGDADVYMLKS